MQIFEKPAHQKKSTERKLQFLATTQKALITNTQLPECVESSDLGAETFESLDITWEGQLWRR